MSGEKCENCYEYLNGDLEIITNKGSVYRLCEKCGEKVFDMIFNVEKVRDDQSDRDTPPRGYSREADTRREEDERLDFGPFASDKLIENKAKKVKLKFIPIKKRGKLKVGGKK